jgi:hypothetical protein
MLCNARVILANEEAAGVSVMRRNDPHVLMQPIGRCMMAGTPISDELHALLDEAEISSVGRLP